MRTDAVSRTLVLKKFLPLILLATLLPFVASFLATPILRVLKNVFGGRLFWTSGIVVTAVLVAAKIMPVAFFVSSLWILVGLYSELEDRSKSGFGAAILAIGVSCLWVVLGHFLSVRFFAVDAVADIQRTITELLNSQTKPGASAEPLTSWSGAAIDAKFIAAQIPSVLVILQMINLAFAFMLERRTAILFGLPFERIVTHWRLLEFKVPEYLVWAAMLSFLGTFVKIPVSGVGIWSTNVFSVFMALYFFQGMAILEVALLSFRAGPFMRFLVYFIVVGQLFFVLSAVGFADYWLDFRKRLKKLRLNINNRKHGEQL